MKKFFSYASCTMFLLFILSATILEAQITENDAVIGNLRALNHIKMGTNSQTNKIEITPDKINFGSRQGQHINLYDTRYGIGIESGTQFFRTANQFKWYKDENLRMILKDDNLGIGTSNPTERLHVAGNIKATGTIDATNITVNGSSVVPNFGQVNSHSTYQDFNATVAEWGWNYVQGSTNGPNSESSQWYRFVGSLGKEYAIDQYRIELAYPRFNQKEAGVWMRTMENGTLKEWTKISGGSDILSFALSPYYGVNPGEPAGVTVGNAMVGQLPSADGMAFFGNKVLDHSNSVNNFAFAQSGAGVTYFNSPSSINMSIGGPSSLKVQIHDAYTDFRSPTVFRDKMIIGGSGPSDIPDGVDVHVDGRLYISENGGSEKGFTDMSSSDSPYHDYLLWVEEGIVSKDFALSDPYLEEGWPDFVFAEDYNLSSLSEVQTFIQQNGHLPTIPSAQEIGEQGYSVHDMNKRMLQTVEELTLHTIAQDEHIINLEEQLSSLLKRVEQLEQQ